MATLTTATIDSILISGISISASIAVACFIVAAIFYCRDER